LTGSVRRLEESCGAQLLEKAGRGIRLTPAGQVLLKWAQRIRNDVESAKREMDTVSEGLSGHIRIGIVPTAAQSLLPAAVRQLLAQAPEATLKVVIGLIDKLIPMLRAGDLDVMVGTEGAPETGIISAVLAEDHVVVAASAEHQIFRAKPQLRDLNEYRWVLQQQGAPTRDWLDHTFDQNNLPRPRVQIESSMLVVMPALIAETDLLSFIPRHHLALPTGRAKLREVPVKQTTMRRRLVISYRESTYAPPIIEQFINLLTTVARNWSHRDD
jgi:DNA-binding transcriptional LysR family regulator